jgi:hypothetical protein
LVAQAGPILDALLAFEFRALTGSELREGIAEVSGRMQSGIPDHERVLSATAIA